MKRDIILSGVGGQGILSIAAVIGRAALEDGLHIKQAEVHGMSQRGGDVQSYLRISSSAIRSDLIPRGAADLIVSMEPMEALRYLPWLADDGWVITGITPLINIPNYPEGETLRRELEKLPHAVVLDADAVAKAAMAPRSANMALLGAAAPLLGIDAAKLEYVMELKNIFRGRIKEYADRYPSATYYPGQRPWGVKCDIAMPCATQNELNGDEAQALVDNGCICVAEGANMPSTPDAIRIFQQHKLLYAPGKAANAGGVATSGLEMTQNSIRLTWSPEEVDAKLKSIMQNIHAVCVRYGTQSDGYINYVVGANIGGFMKVANAMLAQGCV